MQNIQKDLLNFIEDNIEENLNNLYNDKKIGEDQYEFKSFLHILFKIAHNYHYNHNFYEKIDKILEEVKDKILKYFSNSEIFSIFKSNKRILLFLIESKIIQVDKNISNILTKRKYIKKQYHQYFSPEISPFIDEIINDRTKTKEEEENNDDWIEDIKFKFY